MKQVEETLSVYVKRVMQEKNLGVRDIERNSAKAGMKIAASHISKVSTGVITNLTADKIVGLALGLKVDPHEVFAVISGHPLKEASSPDLRRFAGIINELAENPILLEATEQLMRFDTKNQIKAVEMLKRANTLDSKPIRKKKKR
jgi:hypothetical protein